MEIDKRLLIHWHGHMRVFSYANLMLKFNFFIIHFKVYDFLSYISLYFPRFLTKKILHLYSIQTFSEILRIHLHSFRIYQFSHIHIPLLWKTKVTYIEYKTYENLSDTVVFQNMCRTQENQNHFFKI